MRPMYNRWNMINKINISQEISNMIKINKNNHYTFTHTKRKNINSVVIQYWFKIFILTNLAKNELDTIKLFIDKNNNNFDEIC
jgi:hypothetical protein